MARDTEFLGKIVDAGPFPRTHQSELEIVIPYTTIRRTRVALRYVERMARGLACHVRLIRFQIVPIGVPIDRSPVQLDFLENQLKALETCLACSRELFLVREIGPILSRILDGPSVLVMATPKRFWRTSEERLASILRRHGHTVLMLEENTLCSTSFSRC